MLSLALVAMLVAWQLLRMFDEAEAVLPSSCEKMETDPAFSDGTWTNAEGTRLVLNTRRVELGMGAALEGWYTAQGLAAGDTATEQRWNFAHFRPTVVLNLHQASGALACPGPETLHLRTHADPSAPTQSGFLSGPEVQILRRERAPTAPPNPAPTPPA